MKILIITQSVDKNNSVLGFFHRWIEKFCEKFDFVTVICLEKGEYNLPSNSKILSLGKEGGASKIKYLLRFYKYIWQERGNYDVVFVHMNPIYVILGAIFWIFYKKKIGLWYTHKNVDTKLIFAEKLTNFIFTASEDSFRMKSKKINVTGHGIDIDFFKPSIIQKENIILSVGRISETKRLIDMLIVLKNLDDFKLQIIGSPITVADQDYYLKLKSEINHLGINNRVEFIGNLQQNKLLEYYNKARILLNLSKTGSLDKVVLESMSVGLPVITTNEAFSNNQFKTIKIFLNDISLLSSKVESFVFIKDNELSLFSKKSRDIIIKNHSLSKLMRKLYIIFNI